MQMLLQGPNYQGMPPHVFEEECVPVQEHRQMHMPVPL